jgi:hypothetical protein
MVRYGLSPSSVAIWCMAPHGIKIVGSGVEVEPLLSRNVYFYTDYNM